MKRNILLIILLFFAFSVSPAIAKSQKESKSEVELLIKKISRIDSPEINYTYVSMSMIERMFASLVIEMPLIKDLFSSLKSLRSVSTSGKVGYEKVKKMVSPFLQEEEEVMGLSLVSFSREGNADSVLYGDENNLLIINDDGNSSISVELFVGFSYDTYQKYIESGVKIM